MRPCKITVEGKLYRRDELGVVRVSDAPGSFVPVDEETAARVRAAIRRSRARIGRRGREEALRSCGLVKVRGALGGTYWE